MPETQSEEIHAVAPMVTYGWGVIPALAVMEKPTGQLSCFKDSGSLMPIRASVRKAESLELGNLVGIALTIDVKY
ncbi:MAG: DUF1905 domain-containing protein [Acidimicrobiales bacterium]